LDQAYEFALPYRKPVSGSSSRGTHAEGASRTDRVFDNTAETSLTRFAGRLLTDLTPPFQPFFKLEAGPMVPKDQREGIDIFLAEVTDVLHAALRASNFESAVTEMYFDLAFGTGAMWVGAGDDDELIEFITVFAPDVALEEGPTGRVEGIHWKRDLRPEDIQRLWPKGDLSKKILDAIEKKSTKPICLSQSTIYDPDKKVWRLFVFECSNNTAAKFIHEEEFKSCPWLTPRFTKTPGEVRGRGPVLTALPASKTANKVVELTLKNAAFAMLGLWTAVDDGVFNPDMARVVPGEMLKVARNGGPFGPSIKTLDSPRSFDVSNLVLQDMREQVRGPLMDRPLPSNTGAVRSATEIIEKAKLNTRDYAGVFGRLVREIVVPLARRLIEIMGGKKLLPIPEGVKITIDELLVRVQVTSPLAGAQAAEEAGKIVDWLSMSLSLVGKEVTMLSAKVEDIPAKLAKLGGIDPELSRTVQERGDLQKMVAQIMASSAEAQGLPPEAGAQAALQTLTGGGAAA
jgi:hypothetical protein